jgi:predicted DCC family thiol-disulfide oxidoreductase YuxK
MTLEQYTVIYDDSCPICQAAADRVRHLDQLKSVQVIPISKTFVLNSQSLPFQSKMAEAICVLTPQGQLLAGSDALAVLASLLPRTRWIGRLLRLPGIKQIARPVYRLIARHRLRLSRLISAGS